MEPKIKVWLEEDGNLVFSEYRMALLESIASHESLARAAKAMGLSYRRAWGKLREIEANLGYKLIESAAGGAGGGHTRLTAEGERLLETFRRLRLDMEAQLRLSYGERFAGQ